MTHIADGLTPETRRRLETFLDRWRDDNHVPGASVAVFDRDGLRYADGQGARDLEAMAPATADTRYPFASVSKVVTAAVVLKLVDRGKLALDSEIRDHVDVWTDVPGDPITVAELLSHSSGMPSDYGNEREFLFAEDPPASPVVTLDDLRRHVDDAARNRIVDEERFMYCNRGYHVLGMLVEPLDGRPFDEVVESEVFEPLGMARSTVGYGPLSEVEDAITGYTVEEGVPTPGDFDLEETGLGPDVNGVLSPVTEMARFARCLMNGGELDGTRLLSEDLVEAMCSHQVTARETIDGDVHGCGYGPRVQPFLGETCVHHTGTAPATGRAYLGFLPDRGLGVTLGVNNPDVRIGVLGRALLAISAGEDPEAVVPHLRLREKVRAVAGTYESPRGSVTATVEPAGSDSYIRVESPGLTFPAFPESTAPDDYSFSTVWAGGWRGTVDFHETEDGMELRMVDHRLHRTHLAD